MERLSPANVDLVAAGTPSIGAGEREVIALALGNGVTAVMDDRRARSHARRLGVHLTGTLGVLATLHYAGQARQSFEQDVDTLDEAGMYLTTDLKQQVIDRFRTGLAGM